MNDHTQIIARVISDMKRKGYFLNFEKIMNTRFFSYLQPVWKYAYYNPAKLDENGAVVFSQSRIVQLLTIIITGLLTIGMFIARQYILSLFPLLILIAAVIYDRFFYQPVPMTVNATGITLKGETYHWKDYIGAFYCFTVQGKSVKRDLVLIRQNGDYSFLILESVKNYFAFGTAVRDFQPESWKVFNDIYVDHPIDGFTKGVVVIDSSSL
jgi:hypothetical protein